jgi:serine/threonine-protein kinase
MKPNTVGRPVSPPRPSRPFWFAPANCEIVREIGRGGMSTVYEAIDYQTYQPIALKVSIPEASLTQLRRFAVEAEIGQKLSHPSIARTFGCGRFDGGVWMTMELVDGAALSRVIDSEQLDLTQRLQILVHIADALEHVHSHGIIHRDIKPGNIILSKEGPKLVDFGIAKTPAIALTHPRYVVGTPDYLAPEQIVGKGVDHRVDIFQLGLLAFQLFATRLPWVGQNMVEIGWAICFDPPAKLSEHLRAELLMPAEVAEKLESIISRSLERNRQNRFESARDFGKAIGGLYELLRRVG